MTLNNFTNVQMPTKQGSTKLRKQGTDCGHQRPAETIPIVVLRLTAFNIRDSHHTLVVLVAVRIHCFVVDIVVEAASAGAEAGRRVARRVPSAAGVAADIAVGADIAEVEAGRRASFAAVVEAGCRSLHAWAAVDCPQHCGFFRRYFVLPIAVAPKEPF